MSGWQQDQVEAAATAEVKRLAGLLERPEAAARLLADRLSDRLEETGGGALVDRPYPWLIRRSLVQCQACSDRRCDDGIRLDTGGECENCNNVLHIRSPPFPRPPTLAAPSLVLRSGAAPGGGDRNSLMTRLPLTSPTERAAQGLRSRMRPQVVRRLAGHGCVPVVEALEVSSSESLIRL